MYALSIGYLTFSTFVKITVRFNADVPYLLLKPTLIMGTDALDGEFNAFGGGTTKRGELLNDTSTKTSMSTAYQT